MPEGQSLSPDHSSTDDEDGIAEPRTDRGAVLHFAMAFAAAARMQLRTTRANIEDLTWVVTEPLLAVVAIAVLVHAGRSDLASHALCASFLMTTAQMGFWVGSDVLAQERSRQTLELSVICPTPFIVILFARVLIISCIGLLGLGEGWFIVRVLFGVKLTVHHPLLLVLALVATVLSAACTSVLMSALFSLARTARTLQNAVYGPLCLLGGVLVPAEYLPGWLRPLSPFVFLSWSADLVRDAFNVAAPAQVGVRLAVLVALGLLAGLFAALITSRILDKLRRDGSLGLS